VGAPASGAVCITSMQLCFGFLLQHTMCCATYHVLNQNQAAAALLPSQLTLCEFTACMLPSIVLCATGSACVFYLAGWDWFACMQSLCAMHACFSQDVLV
jgi:hypothetical protein